MISKRTARIGFFTFVAALSGLILQCASDPAVTGDGGLVDRLLADMGITDAAVTDGPVVDRRTRDSIGPKAEAAGGSALRTVYSGNLDSAGDFKVCVKTWRADDPPVAMLWIYPPNNPANVVAIDSGNLYIKGGCLTYEGAIGYAQYPYRLAVVE